MTDDQTMQFQHEGQDAFPPDTENDNSADSSSEENKTDDTHSPDGEGSNNQDDSDKDVPFHKHPRWTKREEEWDKRFNDQETRHQEDLKKIREEFSGARKDNAEKTKLPSWFGGTQEQWDAYRADEDARLKQAEDRALQRITDAKSAEDKAVTDATNYFKSEVTTIEADKTLNPDSVKIDPNKLLKIVLDNDLVDSKGNWNYRAGFRIYLQQNAGKPAVDKTGRKNLAGATNSESKGETKAPTHKTSKDYANPANRPW